MSNVPAELKYAESHEWISLDADGSVRIGVSDHAHEALGDLVFVELPPVGDTINRGDSCAVVESVKAASDIYSPVTGEVIAINENLEDDPAVINSDPYGDGWLFQVMLTDAEELDSLLDAKAYSATLED